MFLSFSRPIDQKEAIDYFSSPEKTGWISGLPHAGSNHPKETPPQLFPTDRYHIKHLTQPGYSVLKPNPSTLATEHRKANKQFRTLLQMFARHLYLKGLQLNFLCSFITQCDEKQWSPPDFDFSQFSSLTQYPPSFRWFQAPFCSAHRLLLSFVFSLRATPGSLRRDRGPRHLRHQPLDELLCFPQSHL